MARKRQILPDRWNSYFDAFNRDHKEQAISVEVYGEDIGKEIIVPDTLSVLKLIKPEWLMDLCKKNE